MTIPIWAAIAAVVLIVAMAAALVRRGSIGRGDLLRAPPVHPAAARPAPSGVEAVDPALVAEVRAMLVRGSTIDAIKHVREATGLGLFEAKELVEQIAAEGS